MSLRDRQKAKRKAEKTKEEEFQKKTGVRKPLTTYKEMREQFHYEMARMEVKEQKMKDMKVDAGAMADYNDLTVTDDDFAEEERDRFQNFLKQRKEDKELGSKFYGDEKALREKRGYDDDYLGVSRDELNHAADEQERITDLLKREMPKAERIKEREKLEEQKREFEAMDENLM